MSQSIADKETISPKPIKSRIAHDFFPATITRNQLGMSHKIDATKCHYTNYYSKGTILPHENKMQFNDMLCFLLIL
jgi:hypothetical protein